MLRFMIGTLVNAIISIYGDSIRQFVKDRTHITKGPSSTRKSD